MSKLKFFIIVASALASGCYLPPDILPNGGGPPIAQLNVDGALAGQDVLA
jgi:hypothetical protein